MADYQAVFAAATRAIDDALGPTSGEVDRPRAKRTSDDLAGRIDHTLLKADATQPAVETLCAEARENGSHRCASIPAGAAGPRRRWPIPR